MLFLSVCFSTNKFYRKREPIAKDFFKICNWLFLFNDKYELDIRLEKQKEFNNFDYSIYKELRPMIPANLGLRVVNVIPTKSEKINVMSMVIYKAKKVLKENSRLTNLVGEKVFNNTLVYRLKKEV